MRSRLVSKKGSAVTSPFLHERLERRLEFLLACGQGPLDAAIDGARGVLHLAFFGPLIVWID